MTTLLFSISQIQSSLNKELHDVRSRVEKCEVQGRTNFMKIEKIEKKIITELSRYHIKEEETVPYVFSAPPRNRYFAGRTDEIRELNRIFQVEETLKENRP